MPHTLQRVGAPLMTGWHFTNGTLRDGKPVPPAGEWLRHDGPIEPCVSGLHASPRVLDALAFAPGATLHRVELRGNVTPHGDPVDKFVARERRVLWALDASVMDSLLRRFARLCALDVIHLWDAPDVVVRYLRTGDEKLRDAAWHAARDAAWYAARDAARGHAARDAGDAAWYAADAARDAAAAWDTAWYAARDAAWAARDAARDAWPPPRSGRTGASPAWSQPPGGQHDRHPHALDLEADVGGINNAELLTAHSGIVR
jgi:hypothetical protein